MITITAYYHAAPESLYEIGKTNGLKGEALDFFRYAEEVKISMEVDEKTGQVKSSKVVE